MKLTNRNPLKLLSCFVLGLAAATAVCAPPPTPANTEGWGSSKADFLKGPDGKPFVRLHLEVDRGGSSLGNLVNLEPGCSYDLKIEYQSSDEVSARDNGSWIYFAYKDGKDKQLGDDCKTLEKAASWVSKSFPLTLPAGTEKVAISIRQQNRKGTLDIKSVELKSNDGNAASTLSPAALAALEYISTPGEKLSPEGERSPLDGNIFSPYLKGIAPKIVKDLGTETVDDVQVHKVVFRSMTVGGETQDVYAIIARPPGDGPFPGVLLLHGGYGCADAKTAIHFAKAGYVAISPDLPGIADPKNCPNSVGPWAARFAKLGKRGMPDPTADETFDAVVAALQAFDLLAAQPGVKKDRIGVSGISMGGYSTTMITGLLGKRVRAAYSIFGCGFYDRGSEWSPVLKDLPDDQREAWLHHFDAGRRASGIQAPYFIGAAASDRFFWPPAVNATLCAISGARNQVFAPGNHSLKGVPGGDNIALLYFSYWLKGEGEPFPQVTIESCENLPDGAKKISFFVQSSLPIVTATAFVTAGGESWQKSAWEPILAQPDGEKKFQVIIPADKINKKGAWFVNVSDARPATAGSLVYGMDASGSGPALHALGTQEQK
ncbi:MAG: alpha/beta hydrolase family protein [Terrimicrobiaceae bacterium]